MRDLSDHSVDCFICDLPYGCLHAERKRDKTKWWDRSTQARGTNPWDVKINLAAFWIQVKRLARDDKVPILMFCNTRFGIDLINSNPSWFQYELVWDKGRGSSFLSANRQPMSSHEMVYVFCESELSYEEEPSVEEIIKTELEGRMPLLLQGDCLEVMRDLSDHSIDCFICDLPYGCLAKDTRSPESIKKYNRGAFVGGTSSGGCAWDIKIDLAAFWIQVKRLARDDKVPVLMFCNTKFGNDLINSNPSWFRYDLVWDKGRGVSFLLANKMPMKSHEMIYVFAKKGAFYKRKDEDAPGKKKRTDNTEKPRSDNVYHTSLTCSTGADEGKKCVISVISIKKVGTFKQGHPTEKPVALYKWLLERYCPPGGTVLDPTAGSFNAIIAAEELGMEGIGIEKDEGFFEKAVKKWSDVSGNIIEHV